MTPIRYRLSRLLIAAGDALDSQHGRAIREARQRHLVRRAVLQEFGDECERAVRERDAEPEPRKAVTAFTRKLRSLPR